MAALDCNVEPNDHPVNDSEWDIQLADPYFLVLVLELPIVLSVSEFHGEHCCHHGDKSAVEDKTADSIARMSGIRILPMYSGRE